MILAFSPIVTDRTTRDRVDHLTWDALRCLGELTTAANFAATTEDALLLHARAHQLREAVLALEDIALTRADAICGRTA
jgi:hypothetical protein